MVVQDIPCPDEKNMRYWPVIRQSACPSAVNFAKRCSCCCVCICENGREASPGLDKLM
ncbi:hypothetical protein BD309DRAFT_282674 [Dichomitus squalens]|nr:hypothetical protein BD309DRAFT_282674 [Dichomitus squalens]